MKLGVLAAGIAGAALIAGGPTAVWVVSHNTYGDGDRDRAHVKVDRPHLKEHLERGHGPGLHEGLPLPPGLQGRLPEERLKRLEELRAYAEWARCVVSKAAEATGPFDPAKECGPKPGRPDLGPPMEIPEQPESDDY